MGKNTAEKILLGYGVVTVNNVKIGLTKGGSSFKVEREYRHIDADGDRGKVKDRLFIDREDATLSVKGLELFNAEEMNKYYPGMSVSEDGAMTSTLAISKDDYSNVVWTGKTKDGKAVVITIKNALNLNNIEWTLEDKSEVVPEIGFIAHYTEDERDTPPWSVSFEK